MPGDEHLYSNSGYFLLSAIVQRAAGVTMRRYAAKHVFEPLGMNSTRLRRSARGGEEPGARIFAQGTRRLRDGHLAVSRRRGRRRHTTVEDLAKWDRVFYDSPLAGGKALIDGISRSGAAQQRNDARVRIRPTTVPMYRGVRTIRHGGAWAGYRAEMLRFPDQRTTVIVLANLSDSESERVGECRCRHRPERAEAACQLRPRRIRRQLQVPRLTDVQTKLVARDSTGRRSQTGCAGSPSRTAGEVHPRNHRRSRRLDSAGRDG
ncbi:MAG: beta-lactamase family protein [Blastocatellia bacterium]|nr:beta-lactamase family protein [Blastocatellia bacterium]